MTGTFQVAGALFAGELVGDALVRVANKVAGKAIAGLGAMAQPALRIGVGLLAAPLLRMAGLPARIRESFAAVNIASGLIGLTFAMRTQAFKAIGLGEDETTNAMLGDYELAQEDELYDYELAEYPPAGVLGYDDEPPAGVLGAYGRSNAMAYGSGY